MGKRIRRGVNRKRAVKSIIKLSKIQNQKQKYKTWILFKNSFYFTIVISLRLCALGETVDFENKYKLEQGRI